MNSYEKNIGPLNIDTLRIIATGLIGSEYAAEFIAYRELFAKWVIFATPPCIAQGAFLDNEQALWLLAHSGPPFVVCYPRSDKEMK